jgi:ABC-type multidrug transport system fused ATPase/permease subunit
MRYPPAGHTQTPPAQQRPKAPLVQLLRLVSPYKMRFCIALCSLGIGSGINLLFPEVVRRALEPTNLSWIAENLGSLTALLAGLFAVQGLAFFARSYLFGTIGQEVYADLRKQLFEAVLAKEILFFDRNRSGDLASRINSDAALVQEAVAVRLSVIIRYGLQVVVGVILMTWMSWQLSLAIVASVLVMVGISGVFIRSLKAASRRYQTELAKLSSFAAECFSGAKILRSLGAQSDVAARYRQTNQAVLRAGSTRVAISSSFSSGASLLLNLLLLLVLWYGIHLVLTQSLPVNELAAFVLYGGIVAVSFSFLVSAYTELMQGLGGLERVFELVEGAQRIAEPEDGVGGKIASSLEVSISHVNFAYPDRPEIQVLRDFSCHLAPGSITALVGPSGSGKSSIVQLLLNLYQPQGGVISINGESLTALPEESLRASIAWVPQEPELFGFSVFDNLILGNQTLLRDEILKTVRAWEFLDFIAPLEHGIDTVLGEHGTLVSGGQRQRIAIARALLRKPALLILDEATSGLDSQTEAKVMATIRSYIPNATVLVISHRLATVQGADTIYVINEGRVFERGTHAELIHHDGIYNSYVTQQALG